MRAAMVGGAGYAVGKRRAQSQEHEAQQDAEIQQGQAGQAPPASGGGMSEMDRIDALKKLGESDTRVFALAAWRDLSVGHVQVDLRPVDERSIDALVDYFIEAGKKGVAINRYKGLVAQQAPAGGPSFSDTLKRAPTRWIPRARSSSRRRRARARRSSSSSATSRSSAGHTRPGASRSRYRASGSPRAPPRVCAVRRRSP